MITYKDMYTLKISHLVVSEIKNIFPNIIVEIT
jgi:hypothetical protein